MYVVTNFKTGKVVGKYKTLQSAIRAQNKADLTYGAICTKRVKVEE